MKTTCIKLLAVLILGAGLSVMPAHSQNRGFRSGVALTTLSKTGDLGDNDQMVVSFTAGAFRAFPVKDRLYLLPELNYMKKGRSENTQLTGYPHQADYHVHYLQVPVQLQYVNTEIVSRPGAQMHFHAGPYVAFALKDKVSSVDRMHEKSSASLEETEKTDFGLSIGMGYQRPLAGNHLRVDLKYDMGLAEVANHPDDFRTKALSLTLGVAF